MLIKFGLFSLKGSSLWGDVLGRHIQSCVWSGVSPDHRAFSLVDTAGHPSDKTLIEDLTDKGGSIFPSFTHTPHLSGYILCWLKFPWQSSKHLLRAQTASLHLASSRESASIPLRSSSSVPFPWEEPAAFQRKLFPQILARQPSNNIGVMLGRASLGLTALQVETNTCNVLINIVIFSTTIP